MQVIRTSSNFIFHCHNPDGLWKTSALFGPLREHKFKQFLIFHQSLGSYSNWHWIGDFFLYCLLFLKKPCSLVSRLERSDLKQLENTNSCVTQFLLFRNALPKFVNNTKVFNASIAYIQTIKRHDWSFGTFSSTSFQVRYHFSSNKISLCRILQYLYFYLVKFLEPGERL